MKNKMHCIHYICRMESHQILLLAAGCVLLYFLWLNCSAETFVEEGFRAGRFAKNAARKVKKGVKNAVGKAKGQHGDMTGLTFVCKAVDLGGVGGGPHAMIGPMATGAGIANGKGGKGGRGKDRRGPRNTPTRGLVADLKAPKKKKYHFKLPKNA